MSPVVALDPIEHPVRLRSQNKDRVIERNGGLTGDQVAWEVGYTDPGALRKMFTRIAGLTRADYRKRLRM